MGDEAPTSQTDIRRSKPNNLAVAHTSFLKSEISRTTTNDYNIFCHKCAVCTITYIEPRIGDNEIDLCVRAEGVHLSGDTSLKVARPMDY